MEKIISDVKEVVQEMAGEVAEDMTLVIEMTIGGTTMVLSDFASGLEKVGRKVQNFTEENAARFMDTFGSEPEEEDGEPMYV